MSVLTTVLLPVLLVASPVQADAPDHAGDPASSAIRFYQRYLSSLRHVRCRFRPSCSEFAAQALARYGLVEGSARAADRLMRCNPSASAVHLRVEQGLLADPVDPEREPPSGLRAPPWLLPAPQPESMPAAASLAPEKRARADDALDFAGLLERRGGAGAAAVEYQRAAFLADTLAADAWAFTRIGNGHYDASQWAIAEGSYLTAAMLLPLEQRTGAALRAAASRFGAGSYAACARLLDDPAFAPTAVPDVRSSLAARAAALGGLCLLALGDWAGAEARFANAQALADTSGLLSRVTLLTAFAREGPDLPHRSPGLAAAMSAVLPGAGQAYGGRTQDGLRHLLFNAALIYSVVALARAEEVPGAVVLGGVALPFYLGNVHGARGAAQRFNRTRRLELLERALDRSR